jgi:hypothetical protein
MHGNFLCRDNLSRGLVYCCKLTGALSHLRKVSKASRSLQRTTFGHSVDCSLTINWLISASGAVCYRSYIAGTGLPVMDEWNHIVVVERAPVYQEYNAIADCMAISAIRCNPPFSTDLFRGIYWENPLNPSTGWPLRIGINSCFRSTRRRCKCSAMQ